jgi:L-alanine-DL-glutamate epimerase-like enolase superfamily enzyme
LPSGENCLSIRRVKLNACLCELRPASPWKIARATGAAPPRVVIVELTDADGLTGLGEAAPSVLSGEPATGVLEFCRQLDAAKISFNDVPGSMAFLASLPAVPVAARCALNLALLDGAARRAGRPLHDFLGLGFRENHHVTSFSIGLDAPDNIRKKVLAAADFPVLKLKAGDPRDQENLAALR